jgi:hypothetical protein
MSGPPPPRGRRPPVVVDVACLLVGALAVPIAWAISGLRLTIPLAGLWLLAEAATPRSSRAGGPGTERTLARLRRAVDLAGYGGLLAASVLLVSGGVLRADDDLLDGLALIGGGVVLGLLAASLFATLIRSGPGSG